MNRRGFLRLLAGTAAASTTAYFFAPIGGWKSDVIAHATCPPRCNEHLHLWQVEEQMARMKREMAAPKPIWPPQLSPPYRTRVQVGNAIKGFGEHLVYADTKPGWYVAVPAVVEHLPGLPIGSNVLKHDPSNGWFRGFHRDSPQAKRFHA